MSRKSLVPVNVPALSSAPTLPTLVSGDLYFNTGNSTLYSYTGSAWVAAGTGTTSSVAISDTAPSSPTAGTLWFDSITGQLFIYYLNYWLEVGGGNSGASSVLPYIYYLDGGSSGVIGDIIYDGGTSGSTVTSWSYTIDAGTSVISF
jgi:hypothetical protein